MKKCVACGVFKPEDEYVFRNKLLGRRWGTCKSCQSDQRADWYQRNKEEHKKTAKKNKMLAIKASKDYVWNYLSTHPCVDCGEDNPIVLEFDHVRGTKRKTLSQLAGEGYSIQAIQKEINKCEVRCAYQQWKRGSGEGVQDIVWTQNQANMKRLKGRTQNDTEKGRNL